MTDIPKDTHVVSSQPKTPKGRILMLTTDGTEDQEFFYPYYRFNEAGYQVDVVTPDGKDFKGKNGAGLEQTKPIAGTNVRDYDMLYIPGGKAPAKLKKDDDAVQLVQDFVQTGKPVAAICHGPQLLAEADVINGIQISAWPEVQEEVEEAGAIYQNRECLQDGQFITARWPGDLPAHMAKVMQVLQSGSGSQKMAA